VAVPVVIDCTQLVRDRCEAFVHTWWIVAVFADQINETGEHLSKQETDVGRVSGTWRNFLNNLKWTCIRHSSSSNCASCDQNIIRCTEKPSYDSSSYQNALPYNQTGNRVRKQAMRDYISMSSHRSPLVAIKSTVLAALLLALEFSLVQAVFDGSRLLDEVKIAKHLRQPYITSTDSTASVCNLSSSSKIVRKADVERDCFLDLVNICI
jgi:hypothetical protein